MTDLALEPALISALIDKPSILASPSSIGLSQDDAALILSDGYTHGFRCVFILNASWTAFATIASILLIKQQNLTDDSAVGAVTAPQEGKLDG